MKYLGCMYKTVATDKTKKRDPRTWNRYVISKFGENATIIFPSAYEADSESDRHKGDDQASNVTVQARSLLARTILSVAHSRLKVWTRVEGNRNYPQAFRNYHSIPWKQLPQIIVPLFCFWFSRKLFTANIHNFIRNYSALQSIFLLSCCDKYRGNAGSEMFNYDQLGSWWLGSRRIKLWTLILFEYLHHRQSINLGSGPIRGNRLDFNSWLKVNKTLFLVGDCATYIIKHRDNSFNAFNTLVFFPAVRYKVLYLVTIVNW